MTKLFTLVGEILLRGTDEAKRDIQDLTSTSEKSSSKIEQSAKNIGESIRENFKKILKNFRSRNTKRYCR